MKSPITKLAIAAVFVIACLMGMMMWKGTGSSVALASVLTQVQQTTAYMYQMTMTVTGKGPRDQPLNQNIEGSILIAQNNGMKMTLDMTDLSSGKTTRTEQYVVPQEKAMFTVVPSEKQYVRMDMDDTMLALIRKQNNDPSAMLRQILTCQYQSLGRSAIDGVKVEGFQTTDPTYLGGVLGQADVKIWIDVKTQLPVRMEQDIHLEAMEMHGVMDRFQWDYPVDEATFKPAIPADYTTLPGGPVKTPPMDEAGAIAGLKLLADLTGRYPEKLDFMSVMSQLTKLADSNNPALNRDNPALKQLFGDGKGASKEEVTKKTLDIMMPVEGVALFYMTLVREKKDPVYYGKVVTPQDADQVLLRWKVSDEEYRVIFGSLNVQNVKADVLTELEKTLPK